MLSEIHKRNVILFLGGKHKKVSLIHRHTFEDFPKDVLTFELFQIQKKGIC